MGLVTIPHGIYSLAQVDDTVDATVLAANYITGAALRFRWGTLQPSVSSYDWSMLDAWMSAATAANKKLTVYVTAQIQPPWLLARVPTFRFDDGGVPTEMGIPWNREFLNYFKAFIKEFGLRYSGNPTLTATRGSSEMCTYGWNMPDTDLQGRTWKAYGYRVRQKACGPPSHVLVDAINELVDAFAKYFPTTHHWCESATIAFESEITGLPDLYVPERMAAYGMKKHPTIFSLWRENMSSCIPVYPGTGQWTVIGDYPGKSGAQMVWSVQDLAGGARMNQCGNTPNTKSNVMDLAILRGKGYGMPYFEVYRADVVDSDAPLRAIITSHNATL